MQRPTALYRLAAEIRDNQGLKDIPGNQGQGSRACSVCSPGDESLGPKATAPSRITGAAEQ